MAADIEFRASDSNLSNVYSAGQAPIGSVRPGEIFKVETQDCYGGRLVSPDGWTAENRQWVDDNEDILTGPIAVEGAKAGDVLAITVHDLEITTPGSFIRHSLDSHHTVDWLYDSYGCGSLPIRDGLVDVGHGITVPVAPLIGCMGTAPRPPEVFRNIKNGTFGGNMDCHEMGKGATVTLPSEVEGGLLYFGDCKARIGTGEQLQPPEIGTLLTLSVEVRERPKEMTWPRMEKSGVLYTFASEPDSATAQRTAMREMLLWLDAETAAPHEVLEHLMGMLANAAVCQTVNSLHTSHVSFPRTYVEELRARFK